MRTHTLLLLGKMARRRWVSSSGGSDRRTTGQPSKRSAASGLDAANMSRKTVD